MYKIDIQFKRYKTVQVYVYGFYKAVRWSEILIRAKNFKDFYVCLLRFCHLERTKLHTNGILISTFRCLKKHTEPSCINTALIQSKLQAFF